MRKTITNFLFPALFLLCLLVLGACSPEADSAEDTETVVITNIPQKVNEKDTLDTYKIYVQLSEGATAAAGYVAKGEALISEAELNGNTYTVTITKLKDQNGNPWKGSNNKSVNVVIRPKKVDSIEDIEAKGNLIPSSKILALDWTKLMPIKGIIKPEDYNMLYEGIVVADGLDLGN